MGRRVIKQKFKLKRRDFYATPHEAVLPLLPFLEPRTRFVEPNGGRASLILALEHHLHRCVESYDIKPLKNKWHGVIQQRNILIGDWKPRRKFDMIIGNPPFSAHVLLPMIRLFLSVSPVTWLLLPFGWLATVQAQEFEEHITDAVVIGRIKWFPKSRFSSVDDFAWYRFERKPRKNRHPKVHMRKPSQR